MPAQSPWSLVDPKKVAALGQQALSSGQITPEEAQLHAQALGLMPSGVSMTNTAPRSAVDMNSNNPYPRPKDIPMGNAAAPSDPEATPEDPNSVEFLSGEKPAEYYKRLTTISKDDATKNQRNHYMDPEDVEKAMDVVRNSPEATDLRRGENNLQGLLGMVAGQKNSDPGWVKPLLAYADSQNGSKLLEGYQPGPTREKTLETMLKYTDELQKRKADIVKTLSSGINAQKNGGFTLVSSDTKQNTQDTVGQGSPLSARAMTMRNRLIMQAGSSFDKDPVLLQVGQMQRSLDRAQSMISSKSPITANDAQMLQQDIINAFSPGGVATEGKVSRDVLTPFAAIVNQIMAKGDSIQDLRKDDPNLFRHFQQAISRVQADYSKAGSSRVDELSTNWKDVPDELVQSTVARKQQMLKDKFHAENTDGVAPDVVNYAKKWGISVKRAQAIKDAHGSR